MSTEKIKAKIILSIFFSAEWMKGEENPLPEPIFCQWGGWAKGAYGKVKVMKHVNMRGSLLQISWRGSFLLTSGEKLT